MICLEMIGYFTDKDNSQSYPIPLLQYYYPGKGDFISIVSNLDNYLMTRKIKKIMLSSCDIPIYSLNAPASLNTVDFSDHLNYWRFKYPAIMITDTAFFRNKNYHEDGDIANSLDYKKMAEVTNGVFYLIANFD